MGVSDELGVSCRETPEWLVTAWPRWSELHPDLLLAGDPVGLRAWLRSAGPAEVDEVLFDLAVLAAEDGGDDPDAARALAWVLAPAVSALAARLSSLPGVDHAVASELWLAVRTFPWRRLRKVAANILSRVRTAVLKDQSVGREARRADPVWAARCPLDDFEGLDTRASPDDADEVPPEVLLAEVMSSAIHRGVISVEDRDLLLALAAEIDRHPEASSRSRGGFMTSAVCAAVGARLGCSIRTVRRRALRALDALATASESLRDAA